MTKKTKKKIYKDYFEFLKTKIESSNYKNSASKEEFEKTKAKFEKEKLKRKLL